MAWDVYALRAPATAKRIDEIPEWWEQRPVGQSETVIDAIRRAAPQVDTSDPAWLRLAGDGFEIEIALGKGVQIHDVTFYVRRGGSGAVPVILDICRGLAIVPYETESGDRLSASFEPPTAPPADEDDEPQKRKWWQRG